MAGLNDLLNAVNEIDKQLQAITQALSEAEFQPRTDLAGNPIAPTNGIPVGSARYQDPATGEVLIVKVEELQTIQKGLQDNKKQLEKVLAPYQKARQEYNNALAEFRRAEEVAANPITESPVGMTAEELTTNVSSAQNKVNKTAKSLDVQVRRIAKVNVDDILTGVTTPTTAPTPARGGRGSGQFLRTGEGEPTLPRPGTRPPTPTPTPTPTTGGGGGGGTGKPGQPTQASPVVSNEFLATVNKQFGTQFKTVDEYLNAKGVKGMATKAKRLERWNRFAADRQGKLGAAGGGLTDNVKAIIQQEYGWVAAYIGIDPVVDDALAAFAREEISEDAFFAKVRSSEWWKNTTDFSRQWDLKERTPGSTAQKEIDDRVQVMKDYAMSQFGVVLSPEQLRPWARQTLREGASETTQFNGVSAIIVKGGSQGAIDQLRTGNLAEQLKEINSRYGWDPAGEFLNKSINNIAMGTMTTDMYENEIKRLTKGLYGDDVGELLDRGFSLQEIAEPYTQTAARMLEIDPLSINLKEPKWQAALSTVDPSGKKRKLTLGEWQQTLRTDPKYGWDNTNQAREVGVRVGEEIVRMFGKVQ